MSDDQDILSDAIVAMVPPLLDALETLGTIARHLHPPTLGTLIEALGDGDAPVRAAKPGFDSLAWPEPLSAFKARIDGATEAVCRAFLGLRAAAGAPDAVLQAYRALGQYALALEALYPVASVLPPVSRFFLEPKARGDRDLLGRLSGNQRSHPRTGVMHAGNDKGMHGGFSLYVPEYYDPAIPCPLIMALHGGSGHGRRFLWSWLSEARSRGAILISPTSVGGTWGLMEPELDSENIEAMLGHVRQEWNIDADRMLLTGMSDGGTFTLLSGLRAASPFTHLAPIAASFHPMMLEMADPGRLASVPVHLLHGALDWMFPVAMARAANQALTAAGANVTYREVADLSHTYPRDENPGILDWFAAGA